ncbi:MAG: GNAT family N-acyltransferase [Pseudomonadota bacterium]
MTLHSDALYTLPSRPPEAVTVRLARSAEEVDAAQRLRYRVFFEEMGARPSPAILASGRDHDRYDPVCDHLLAVVDGTVVGTYRLIRRDAAEAVGGFYSAGEFDLAPLLSVPGTVLELGRSCIDARWRSRGVLQALWQGLAAYIVEHRVDLLFGCASLPGTDLDALAPQLAYLRANHLAPAELRARPLPHRMAPAVPPAAEPDPRRVFAGLPPLLKGYLRAGAWVGDGAVVDAEFNTTDVLVVMDTDAIAGRYLRRFEAGQAA